MKQACWYVGHQNGSGQLQAFDKGCLILCGHNMTPSRPVLVEEMQCGHSVKTKAPHCSVPLTMPVHEPGPGRAFSASHVLQQNQHKAIHNVDSIVILQHTHTGSGPGWWIRLIVLLGIGCAFEQLSATV